MSMKYDPIKRSLGKVFNSTPFLRITFYKLLDLLLLRTWHIKRELKKIRQDMGEEINVLDAGSGFGQYSYYMSSLGKNWNINGVDLKEEQMEDCRKFFRNIGRSDRVSFEKADLETFKNPGKYDLILSVDVMEHIEQDVEVFKNFHESLKDGGVLLINTPSDMGGSDVHDDDDHSFIDEHVRDGYNMNEMHDKLKYAGFSHVYLHYAYGKPGKISWRLSMKYPIIMLNVSKIFFIILPFYYLITFPICLILNKMDVNGTHETGTGLIVKAKK